MFVLRLALVLVAVFFAGYFASSYLPSLSQLFTFSSGYSSGSGYGYGGDTYSRSWGYARYPDYRDYPRPVRRPPPPPCYMPCY
jgi:hypothetical protein